MKFPISKQLFEQVEVRRLRMKILSLVLIVYLVFELAANGNPEACSALRNMTKKPWECCNYPTFAVKKEILAACQQKCWQIEETEALQCCIRKCVLRDTGTLEDLKFNGENFQDCLKENHYKEVMSEAWKSVARKSTEKCVIENPASDKMDARGCSLSFVDNIVTCCIVDMFFNCPYYHASSECGETKKIFENCVKEGKGDLVFHILASKPQ